jgi:hypothetical protein
MLVLICQILPEIIERRVLKEVVQYDLYAYTHIQSVRTGWEFVRKLGLTSSYSRPLLLNMVLVATKYPNQQRDYRTHKVMPTRPISVLNDSRAVSSRTMMPGNLSVSYSPMSQQAKLVLNTLIGPQLRESPTADQGYVRFPHFQLGRTWRTLTISKGRTRDPEGDPRHGKTWVTPFR